MVCPELEFNAVGRCGVVFDCHYYTHILFTVSLTRFWKVINGLPPVMLIRMSILLTSVLISFATSRTDVWLTRARKCKGRIRRAGLGFFFLRPERSRPRMVEKEGKNWEFP